MARDYPEDADRLAYDSGAGRGNLIHDFPCAPIALGATGRALYMKGMYIRARRG